VLITGAAKFIWYLLCGNLVSAISASLPSYDATWLKSISRTFIHLSTSKYTLCLQYGSKAGVPTHCTEVVQSTCAYMHTLEEKNISTHTLDCYIKACVRMKLNKNCWCTQKYIGHVHVMEQQEKIKNYFIKNISHSIANSRLMYFGLKRHTFTLYYETNKRMQGPESIIMHYKEAVYAFVRKNVKRGDNLHCSWDSPVAQSMGI